MSTEEKHLYARYFYNCIIEFLYFIILYIETYGSASLCNLSKYVKLFKTEVSTFILIFEGKTAEDKLKQMLLTLDCFEFSDDEIKNLKRANLKHAIYEDFILSKCVDLLLKGFSNVNDICRNLSLNHIIKINKQNFLDVIEKYNFIQINSDQKVSLNHAHGLLGFQDHLYNSVTSYFHNILYHDKLLSFNEVRKHYNSLLFCGLSNVLGVFSILYCSSEFNCQNGFVLLKKKSKKHTNKKPLHMEVVETKFLSRSLPIGQIVYSSQGPFLHQWTGEIVTLRKDCGVIYCVVNFTNGYGGVFNIYFNKASLKVISEIDNLQNYISVRDIVEFDAEYYTGKKLDRCWTATRVKLLSNNKFQYDELLIAKLNLDSELQRNKCNTSICCSVNYKSKNFSDVKQPKYLEGNLKTTDFKFHEEEPKIEDNKSLLNNNSMRCSDIVVPIKCTERNSSIIEQSKFLESSLETTDAKCQEEELKIEDNKSLLNNNSMQCSDIVVPIKCTERNSSIMEQSKFLESNLESTDPKCHEEELKNEDNSLLNNNSMCCSDIVTPLNCTARNSSIIEQSKFLESSLQTTDSKCHAEVSKIEDHKSLLCNLDYKVEPDVSNTKKPVSLNKEKSSTLFISFTNCVIPDYHFMFAHIHMLMSDKGIAVAKYEDKFYNILFMKSSIYPPTVSEQFPPKGQKVLVLIPYLNKVENFCVATLVYGLDEDDLRKLNTVDTTAKEFAMSTIFPLFIEKGINPTFCECFCFANGPKFDQIKYEIQITELNDFIATQYNISLAKDKFQMLLHSLYKANSNGSRFFDQFCSFTIDLYRCFSNYSQLERDKLKNRRKFSRVVLDYENDSQHNINLKDSAKEDRLSNSNLSIKSKSLDAIHASYNSLNSYKTCSDSTESFYSCDSRCNTPKCLSKRLANSCSSLNSQKSFSKTDSLCLSTSLTNSCRNLNSQKSSPKTDSLCLSKSLANSSSSAVSLNSQKSSPKTELLLKINQTTPLPTLCDECSIAVTNVDQESTVKAQKCLQTENNKYLSLQSVPSFKPSCKKKRKMFVLPFMPKPFSKNCIQSTITVTGSVCMVSESFFFFAVNIQSFDTVLPLPKKDVPKSFVEKIKLNSAFEITIKPYVPVHLSQIIRVKLV